MENTFSKKLIWVNECLHKQVQLVMTPSSCTLRSLQRQVKLVGNARMLLKKREPICRTSVNKNRASDCFASNGLCPCMLETKALLFTNSTTKTAFVGKNNPLSKDVSANFHLHVATGKKPEEGRKNLLMKNKSSSLKTCR